MNQIEFFNSLKKQVDKCYLLYGKEEFVKESGLGALKQLVVQSDFEDFNCNILDGNTIIEKIIETAETLPFMGSKRFVVAMDCKSFSSEIEDITVNRLESFLKNLPEYACVVFVFRGEIDKRKKAFKLLIKYATTVNFDYLDPDMATKWVASTITKKGKSIDYKAARLLVNAVGTSCMNLHQEINKLLDLTGEKDVIEIEDLKTIKSFVIEHDVFNMINMFLNKNTKDGFDLLYKSMGDGESGFMILGAVASKFRNYMLVKQMKAQGLSNAIIIKELGGNYGAKRAIVECDKVTVEQIDTALNAFMVADNNIKNGVMSEDIAVEWAICKAFAL